MTQTINLKSGDTHLHLRPGYGGRISKLAFGGWDVVRPIPESEDNPWAGYKGGSFPLVPFSNRIKNGRFSFQGRDISLTTHPQEPANALHGHGCFTEWSVEKTTATAATLSSTQAAGHLDWPWSYQTRQHFVVTPEECKVTIEVTNLSKETMPVGFGFHPFFPFDEDVNLRFKAGSEWLGAPEDFPTEHGPVRHDFSTVAGDNLWREEKTICYEGFEGEVELHWATSDRRLRLIADPVLNHFIVHVPKGGHYFCLEPVSHPTDGFNLAAAGTLPEPMLTLDKGQTTSASMVLIPV